MCRVEHKVLTCQSCVYAVCDEVLVRTEKRCAAGSWVSCLADGVARLAKHVSKHSNTLALFVVLRPIMPGRDGFWGSVGQQESLRREPVQR